jgi:predicted GTPase
MQRLRLTILVIFAAAPVLTLIGFGVYHLWWTGLGPWLAWPLTACLIVAYFFAWRWLRHQRLLRLDETVPMHWTERDRQAWSLVEARAKDVANLKTDQLMDLPFFVQTAQTMALELARLYHPRAVDPVGSLTLPETLAAVELAARDLRKMVDQYLPGGHFLTINDMRRFKRIADWYPTASNITWLLSSIFAPVQTALRYLTVQAGTSMPWQMLQENVLIWFFTAYVHRLGSYLIELNSGRLRVGMDRYLELQNANRPPAGSAGIESKTSSAAEAPSVTLTLAGQTKVGKSSLINALLGEQKAITDVVAATPGVTSYELRPPAISSRLQLLDTVGYGRDASESSGVLATEQAARQADVILLVVHARNPARQVDIDFLKELEGFFSARPELRKPPIVAVLTHIDLLGPSLEWKPPYNWQQPTTTKERNIAAAADEVRNQMGSFVSGVVPVCTAAGKEYGIEEWLLPAVIGLLDEAHAVAFLRCLKAEKDTGKVRKVFAQLLALSKGLGKILLHAKPEAPPKV